MRLESFVGTTREQVDGGHWNPYLGISINNKAFTVGYLYEYMDWAVARARERAAILIVDVIQRINNLVLDRSAPMQALEKAFRKADEVRVLCDKAKSMLAPGKLDLLVILEWPDILYDADFCHNLAVLKEEYEHNRQFRNVLMSLTRRNLGRIVDRLDDAQVGILAHYILNELPELIAGFRHGGIHYNLNVYPGRLSSIYGELLQHDFFREIVAELRIVGEMASIEAYGESAHSGGKAP